MNKTAALSHLKSIPAPLLIDGGYSRSGHTFYIATEAGLITIDFHVYDPIIGPIEYNEAEYQEIKEIAGESGTIEENSDLAPDEQLFLFNNAKPGVQYWAFQPRDNAPLEAYTFSSDKTVIEQKLLDEWRNGETESWDTMDEASLITWAGKMV
ncbi:MAG: hypothetical protein WCI90_00720 [Chlorobium sp.]|nr:MAG: hypothetical protein FDX17_05020 [Chlorobium sp.]